VGSAQTRSIDFQERRHRQKLVLDFDGEGVELRVEVIMVADGPWHVFI